MNILLLLLRQVQRLLISFRLLHSIFIFHRAGVSGQTLEEWRERHSLLGSFKSSVRCEPLVDYDTCGCAGFCEYIPYNMLLVREEPFAACAGAQQHPRLGIQNCTYSRVGSPCPTLQDRILELTKRGVLGILYEKWDGYLDGSKYPPAHVHALSMIGLRRLDSLQFLLEEVIRLNIPGDFIETGVWRGGVSIFAATVFRTYGQLCPSYACRRVFVADSFQGIPPVNVEMYPVDAVHAGVHLFKILRNNSLERVRAAFDSFGVLSDAVTFLPGWFNETLPAARAAAFTHFAVAHLDGDTYESTWQALENVYDRVSPGGFVVVDDYTDWIGCRRAVDDFRASRPGASEIRPVYYGPGEEVRGVWWKVRAAVPAAAAAASHRLRRPRSVCPGPPEQALVSFFFGCMSGSFSRLN